jgi:hypothetical protein
MKWKIIIRLLCLGLLSSCLPSIDENELDQVTVPEDLGILEFRFTMPVYDIPQKNLHRISLGFAYTADSLYRKEFFKKVNVSDFQEVYKVFLPGADYYYDAVITCSCAGDTCLNGAFPGGRYGMKHDFDKFNIENQKNTVIETHFQ